jgi:hypothetical protein
MNPKDWTEDFKHENGNYMNTCGYCKGGFTGGKYRHTCKECHDLHTAKTDEVIDFLFHNWAKYLHSPMTDSEKL